MSPAPFTGLIRAKFYAHGDCSPLLSKRADNAISSCGDTWMPRDDVEIGQGTDERSGFDSAVDRFCDQADGETLASGDSYLSLATETELSFGKPPAEYGQYGFVYCTSAPCGCMEERSTDRLSSRNSQPARHGPCCQWYASNPRRTIPIKLMFNQLTTARAISRSSQKMAANALVTITPTQRAERGKSSTTSCRTMHYPIRSRRRRMP